VVLVISGGLAVKFAYDQGWWQGLPPAFRLTTMSLAGVALLGAGEWVYRKINVIASASLFGAGIAIFLLVSYAGSAYYGLYSRNSALVLMAISTLVGAATALRGNMVSIAVLALIGGNIAPLVLSTDHPHITHGGVRRANGGRCAACRWPRPAYGSSPYCLTVGICRPRPFF